MRLLGSTKNKITKDENGKDMPHLEIVLLHCNVVKTDYQNNWRVLYSFALNESCGQLLDILPKNFLFLKTFNSEFSQWFTDQYSKRIDIEDKVNITLVIKHSAKYKTYAL